MVGPSMSDDETRVANTRLRVGFVLLVGVSGALVALTAGATVLQIAFAFVGGSVLGLVLLWFLSLWGREMVSVNRR
jgi:hypothetical protein